MQRLVFLAGRVTATAGTGGGAGFRLSFSDFCHKIGSILVVEVRHEKMTRLGHFFMVAIAF